MGIASLLSFFFVDGVFGGTLNEGRTAATTTLILLGLCFIVLLERGPGREHITIQSYMLALVAGLGAIFAGILAIEPCASSSSSTCSRRPVVPRAPVRRPGALAGAAWRLPYVQRLELPPGEDLEADGPRPTHTPRTGEFDAVGEAPTSVAPTEQLPRPRAVAEPRSWRRSAPPPARWRRWRS